MPENQQIQQIKKLESSLQRRKSSANQFHVSNPAAIIQHARINSKSLTSADVLQLQCTIGNRAVGRFLSEVGSLSSVAQNAPIQRQEIPEKEKTLQGMFEEKPDEKTCPSCVQRKELEEEEKPLQRKMIETVQRQEIPEEEESLQRVFEEKPEPSICPSCSTDPVQRKEENHTGMPDNLKAGVENLSGIDMSAVRVHYNSSKPAEIGALAYTQGTNIHVAPGQERHLTHEAWHVVQQAQGRVKPTMQIKGGISVNDDTELEREADIMGNNASYSFANSIDEFEVLDIVKKVSGMEPIQRTIVFNNAALGAPFSRGVNGLGVIQRPPWVGFWSAGAPVGTTRNHIIAYNYIAEALVNIINSIYTDARAGAAAALAVFPPLVPAAVALAARGAALGRINDLIYMTDALYPNTGGVVVPEYAPMTVHRTALINAITGVLNFALPTVLEITTMQNLSTALESDLMSARENVRAGDPIMNQRIRDNIDADYGPIVTLPAPPGLLPVPFPIPFGWLGVGGVWGRVDGLPAPLVIGSQFYSLLQASNDIVYRFMRIGPQYVHNNITISINDDPFNRIGGVYPDDAPLSSTAVPPAPPVGGLPVVVFDPTGINLPIRFR